MQCMFVNSKRKERNLFVSIFGGALFHKCLTFTQTPISMRNPKWHREEIILALDLYFNPHRGPIDKNNPSIIELSSILNCLLLVDVKPDEEKFRNPNGVSLKLSNFLALDPQYQGKGMDSYSKLDRELFDEFVNDRIRLRAEAAEIKARISK